MNFGWYLASHERTNHLHGAKTETATFGTGCFWCMEAVFQELKGVFKVTSGYSGGQAINPTYEEVCSGTTGHAECLQFIYDPSVISFDELLEVFWESHDPTQLNRQGNDVGTQYRSAIFYHNAEQKEKAERNGDHPLYEVLSSRRLSQGLFQATWLPALLLPRDPAKGGEV
jgi:methionine-S-sulfoxide reductase